MYRVLVADADVGRAQSYRRFLMEEGYQVETTTGAVECLLRLHDACPDVLLLSTSLLWGGADGLLETLWEEGGAGDVVPVILLGDSTAEPPRHLLRAPVVAYLPTPVPPHHLLARLEAALKVGLPLAAR
jgi:DNA-binding response OmpR family regulator